MNLKGIILEKADGNILSFLSFTSILVCLQLFDTIER